jgi:hypothetical protein
LAERLVQADNPVEASRVRDSIVRGFYGTERDAKDPRRNLPPFLQRLLDRFTPARSRQNNSARIFLGSPTDDQI